MAAPKKKKITDNTPLVCLGISAAAAFLTLLLSSSAFVQNLELKMLNILFQVRGQIPGSPAVMVAAVDEEMVRQQGYPVPRKFHALFIKALQDAGATAVGFDVFFDKPSARPEQDEVLAMLAGAARNARFPATFQERNETTGNTEIRAEDAALVGPYGIKPVPGIPAPEFTLMSTAGEVGPPYTQLLSGLDRLCQVIVEPDPDGFNRKVPLLLEYNGLMYPNLGLQLAMDYLKVKPQDVRLTGRFVVLPTASDTVRIPVDERGYFLINFAGLGDDFGSSFRSYSVFRVLKEYSRKSEIFKSFRDKVCVVGQSAVAVGDIGPTPFHNKTPLHYIHVNVASNIINRNFLARAPGWIRTVLVFVLCLLTGIVLARFKTKFAVPIVAGMLALFGGIAYLLFLQGTWYDTATPALGVLLTYFSCFLWIYLVVEKDERFVKEMFGKYQSEEVLEKMKEKDLDAAGERKELTILFSDVKSFSKISDQVELTELVLQLKEYFDEMTRIIFKYDGYLDKFMGDGIMAFFNDPKERPDHVLCGVKAAWEMQESMKQLREKWGREGKTQFQIRIGLNTGTATVGNLGSTQKFTYTAFGSSVNVASRMESSGRPDGVQVTGRVYEATKDQVEYEDAGEISVKNIVKPVKVYFVKGIKDA